MSPAKISRQLVEVYEANVISRKQLMLWCTEFNKGRTDLRDDQRSRLSSTSTTLSFEHATNSTDLAPSDFSRLLKKNVEDRHFRTNAKVQKAVLTWLHGPDADFLYTSFDNLVCR
ncbi:hypothetical protein AVEN_153716-1 [Araneus ventricosus]|uniref:Mos1 transposase HTH domain-containing protein n=1 Tax=Araneus ventricosus TaxID=182803 RepID=A0A4Y2PRV0_ARAVE|nr:hypothetical protein AVEN_153716-1 [Araneus ventricosus]